jgi:hypothetical protein
MVKRNYPEESCGMRESFAYAEPITIDNVEDCLFYHRMCIPGVGEVGGQWDLLSLEQIYKLRLESVP